MDTEITSQTGNQFADLIARLGDENGFVRQRARLMLVHLGRPSIPYLNDALSSPNVHIRWEAVKALGEFRGEDVAYTISLMLMDDDVGVRWVAAESLIQQDRACLRPLLEVFTKNFDSPWLREGFHHILHVFKDRNELHKEEIELFEKLNKQVFPGFELGWTGEAAWAAEKALEVLDREKD